MATIPERWAEQARYDLETARAMLDSGRFLYVLFCCQQAVEKMLKAVIAKQTGELPPRLHNLNRLAERTGLQMTEERMDFLGELSSYYIQTRYPEEIETEFRQASLEMAQEVLSTTEELIQWLTSAM